MEEQAEIVATQPTEVNILTPEWVKDAVFYQIFPDRFATSARVEKPQNLEPWDSPPTTYGFKGGIYWASSNTSTTSLTSALMRCISAPSFNPRRIIIAHARLLPG